MNNYDNAVPKPLKFLISDGKMIDEQGNVIAESETLKDLYTKWNPEIKKYLLSDGSVVDENDNLIIKNDYYKKMYDQADPKIAKYLHSDGTIDENPGSGGGANLENNKQVSITTNGEIEITPSSGYDGMKKVTANVNVSGGSSLNFYSQIPTFRLIAIDELGEYYPEWDYSLIFAISENGDFINEVANISNAKFLVKFDGVSGSWGFRKNSSDELETESQPTYVNNCDFTVTNGQITLPSRYNEYSAVYTIEKNTTSMQMLGDWLLPYGS